MPGGLEALQAGQSLKELDKQLRRKARLVMGGEAPPVVQNPAPKRRLVYAEKTDEEKARQRTGRGKGHGEPEGRGPGHFLVSILRAVASILAQ